MGHSRRRTYAPPCSIHGGVGSIPRAPWRCCLFVVPPEYSLSKQGYHPQDWTFRTGDGMCHGFVLYDLPVLLSIERVHVCWVWASEQLMSSAPHEYLFNCNFVLCEFLPHSLSWLRDPVIPRHLATGPVRFADLTIRKGTSSHHPTGPN